MSKIQVFIAVVIIILIVVLLYREFVEPSFYIVLGNNMTHTGTFSFAGVENTYGNGNGGVGSHNGWECRYLMNTDGTTTFSLYKRGAFKKTLGNF